MTYDPGTHGQDAVNAHTEGPIRPPKVTGQHVAWMEVEADFAGLF